MVWPAATQLYQLQPVFGVAALPSTNSHFTLGATMQTGHGSTISTTALSLKKAVVHISGLPRTGSFELVSKAADLTADARSLDGKKDRTGQGITRH